MLDFYYRTGVALSRGYDALSASFSLREKALINFFTLKSDSFRKAVDSNLKYCLVDVTEKLVCERVSNRQCIKVLLKCVAHWIFFIFWKLGKSLKGRKYDCLLRSYVDVEYHLFRDTVEATRTLILVFPFPLSVKRQLKYLKWLWVKDDQSFVLCGYPYSLLDVCKFVVRRNQMSLFELEYNVVLKFSIMLEDYQFSSFLNMDDHDPMSVVSSTRLMGRNINVTTYLHGVGTYSPYIATENLKVFNDIQKKYYSMLNDISSIEYYDEYLKDSRDFSLVCSGDVVIFYSQVTSLTMQLLEVESRVIKSLFMLAKKHDVLLVYKKHPNNLSVPSYVRELDLKVYSKELYNENRCFGVSFYSTSFYTENGNYSFLIKTDEVPTDLLFSEEDYIIEERNLGSIFG